MSNETKQDVFERALAEWYDLIFKVGGQGNEAYGYCEFDGTISKYEKDYDDALPDNLPVIPKAVGEYIKERKAVHDSLAFALTARFIPNEVFEWMLTVTGDPDTELSQIEYVKQQDIFARAWVLGVWRVEETGEIVKLEAEK